MLLNREKAIEQLKAGAEVCESKYATGYGLHSANGVSAWTITKATYDHLRNNRLIERAYDDGFRRRWRWRGPIAEKEGV